MGVIRNQNDEETGFHINPTSMCKNQKNANNSRNTGFIKKPRLPFDLKLHFAPGMEN